MENRQKVFISYSRRDFSAVDRLRTALESADFQVLLDLSEYSGGEEWEARLKHIIGVADSVIFVLSENSAKSEICKWELDGARALHKRILSATLAPLDSMPANLLAADYIPIF